MSCEEMKRAISVSALAGLGSVQAYGQDFLTTASKNLNDILRLASIWYARLCARMQLAAEHTLTDMVTYAGTLCTRFLCSCRPCKDALALSCCWRTRLTCTAFRP